MLGDPIWRLINTTHPTFEFFLLWLVLRQLSLIVKSIKNGTLSIPWAKPGGALVRLTSTSVKPRSGSASQNAVPGHLNQESPSD